MKLLAIRRRYLGDIVLLGSVFRNLRAHWPAAHIAALVEPTYAGVLPLHPDVNETLTFPANGGNWALARALRAAKFTHVLDFDNTDKTAFLTRFSGARHRVTFHRELVRFRYRWLYTHRARVANADYERSPISDTYLRLPEALGVPIATREIKLAPPAAALDFAQNLIKTQHPHLLVRRNRLLVHPGSRSEFRLWPAERFARVIDRAVRELGAQVALVAGPGERTLATDIAAHATTKPAVVNAPFSIPQLAAFMTQFDAMLCHDSGPMHLAAGVGTRVVALYGSQNAAIWRPVGERHTVLQTPLPCSCLPDVPKRCVKTDSYRSYCVRKLTEDEVFRAVAATLREGPAPSGPR